MPRQKKLEESSLLGSWQIVCCESSDGLHDNIKGVEFTLDEGDDVTWQTHGQAEPETFPLLTCQTFEIVAEKNEIHFYLSYTGHWIEFKVSFHDNQLVLTSGRNLKLNCKKIYTEDRLLQPEHKFSLLDALKEGYFSDLTLSASNGEKFAVHKTVLSCLCPNENWDTIPSFLQDLPVNVLRVLLHYLYTGSLLEDLSEDTVRDTLKAIESVKCLKPLVKFCKDFLEATAAICKINTLINDLEQALDSVISTISSLQHPDGTCIQPSQLFISSKAVAQQVAIAVVKFVLLCDVFSKRKHELTRKERHKIIESIRNRLPGIVCNLLPLLLLCDEVVQSCLSTEAKQEEVATFFIPEIEKFWKVTSEIVLDAQKTLDDIVEQEDNEQKKKRHSALGSKLNRTFKNAIHLRELKVLKKIQEEARSTFVYVFQKREDFSAMTHNKKVAAVIKTVEFVTDEIETVYIPSLKKFPKIFETHLKFKAWKSLFKVGAARVSWLLERVRQNQSALQPSIDRMCHLVNNESFNRVLQDLKLLDPMPPACSSATQGPPVPKHKPEFCTKSESTSNNTMTDSLLPTAVAELLVSGKYADMTFLVSCCTTENDISHSINGNIINTDHKDTLKPLNYQTCFDNEIKTGKDTPLYYDNSEIRCNKITSAGQLETGQSVVEFKAHRVILAARCLFFKCALLSGMKESIDRTINVLNTNPFIFRKFLESLYLGTLNTDCLSTDQLVEMMTLTDMYEVDMMKDVCEKSLGTCVCEDTVLYLLSVADRYNALQLKKKCFNFMSNTEGYMQSEEFGKLTPELQQEIKKHFDNLIESKQTMTNKEMESCIIPNLEELTRRHLFEQNSQQGQQQTKIDKCLQELTEILGDTIPRRELIRITIAADCDVNRALNFYFSWQSNENL